MPTRRSILAPAAWPARWPVLLPGLVLVPVLGISLFKAPEPEVVYRGSADAVSQGVVVIRDAETFEEAVEPLSPDFGGPAPSLRKRTILRVVGPRLEGCGEVTLSSVSTKGFGATVELRVSEPASGCECRTTPRPAPAWLVSVGRSVRRATLAVEEVAVDCAAARGLAGPDGPALLLEGSWDADPGVTIATDPREYGRMLTRLGVGSRGPEIDFDTHRAVAVTGRPRSNGCRRTLAVSNDMEGPDKLVVTLEEVYAAPDQMCAQVFNLPKVFVYRVPATVTSARVVTKERR